MLFVTVLTIFVTSFTVKFVMCQAKQFCIKSASFLSHNLCAFRQLKGVVGWCDGAG